MPFFLFLPYFLLFPTTQLNEPGVQESFVDDRDSINAVSVSKVLGIKLH